ncbi:MAG TPA: nuclear transport factor 2 family protein [Chryseosolibacter sp.]
MKYFLLSAALCACLYAKSQSLAPDSAIMDPVKKLFQGMHEGDSAMVHEAFAARPFMATVTRGKSGKAVMRMDEFSRFLIAVGTPHDQPWSELIWDVTIKSDGRLAQVWAKYAFYVGRKFSHCGVDAFQLFRDDDAGWRIFSVADTREKEACDVPSSISANFK